MDNIFIIAGVISIIFLITKFIEMRFIEKENKPVKLLVRDTILVYICVLIGMFTYEQVNPIMEGNVISPSVFTDNPGF
jgi:hypothetical protein